MKDNAFKHQSDVLVIISASMKVIILHFLYLYLAPFLHLAPSNIKIFKAFVTLYIMLSVILHLNAKHSQAYIQCIVHHATNLPHNQ